MPAAFGSWTNCFKPVLEFIFPPQCALCGRIGLSSPCVDCRDGFEPLEVSERDETGLLNYRIALYPYTGRPGQAIRCLKYNRRTDLVEFLSGQIAEAVDMRGLDPDLIVPVPIHWSRRCVRGFNQSELLVDRLPSRPDLLRRIRRTRPQVGLSAQERLLNLDKAFWAGPEVAGKHVLLVDDVLTSGQTARECAKALRAAGASEIGILAFCGEI